MIYIVVGNDKKKINEYIKKLMKDSSAIVVKNDAISPGLLDQYAQTVSLFGGSQIILCDNAITESSVSFTKELLVSLEQSHALFIFREDKLLAANQKKFEKYAAIERFEQKTVAKTTSFNVFAIADAFGRRDKIKAWMLYLEAIEAGIEPESISGMLFWKIKNMAEVKDRTFTTESLKRHSSNIVSLYHLAHRGEVDFTIGLEQFILTALSK